MSLLDTIKGARAEAEEAQDARTKKSDATTEGNESAAPTSTGFSRRSVARAKPKREAAGSVQAAKKPESKMTKEERKAAREERLSEQDLRHDAAEALLKEQPAYKRTQRIWWGCVIIGAVCALGSWLIMRSIQNNPDASESTAFLSMGLMVFAYVLVIGAFIFDLVKVRPMRDRATEQVAGVSKKKLRRMAEQAKKDKK